MCLAARQPAALYKTAENNYEEEQKARNRFAKMSFHAPSLPFLVSFIPILAYRIFNSEQMSPAGESRLDGWDGGKPPAQAVQASERQLASLPSVPLRTSDRA